jgi:hypothetical protein
MLIKTYTTANYQDNIELREDETVIHIAEASPSNNVNELSPMSKWVKGLPIEERNEQEKKYKYLRQTICGNRAYVIGVV